jgi:phosphoglycolate phosphatase
MRLRYQTILFDLDGTLTDPRLGITSCIAHALRELNAPIPPIDQLAACIGPPLRDSFANFLQTDDKDLVERAVALYRERFAPIGLYENEVYIGVPALLSELSAQGARIILATSKPHIYARKILEHFELVHHFEQLFGSELDGRNDKKTDLIAHALRTVKFDPLTAVMIGDRGVDMSGGKASGLAAIGVEYGYGDAKELKAAGADQIVDSVATLQASLFV